MKFRYLSAIVLSGCYLINSCGNVGTVDENGVPRPIDGEKGSEDALDHFKDGSSDLKMSTVGNGGDAVVCKTETGISLELLDIFEAKFLRNFSIKDLTPTEDYKIVVEKILKDLEMRDSDLANFYREHVSKFHNYVSFMPNVKLPDIDDNGRVSVVPKNCRLHQLAIQAEPQFVGDIVYIVDKNIWDALDSVNKAALVLHEVIYRDALSRGHNDSYAVRYFNGLLMSKNFEPMSQEEYLKIINSANLPGGSKKVGGFRIPLDMNLQLDSQGNLMKVMVDKRGLNGLVKIFGKEMDVDVTPNTVLEFHASGLPKKISFQYTQRVYISKHECTFVINGASGVPLYTEFGESGNILKSDSLKSVCYPTTTGVWTELEIRPGAPVEFYSNDVPKEVQLRQRDTWDRPITSKVKDILNPCMTSVLPTNNLELRDFVNFHASGAIAETRIAGSPQSVCRNKDGQNVTRLANEILKFDVNGFILPQ